MRIQIVSDIHFEFHRDQGRSVVESLRRAEPDVLVVAGDLSSYRALHEALSKLAGAFSEVVFVAGNHEYYGGSPGRVRDLRDRVQDDFSNIHWLDKSSCAIKGQRFVGATLWFPRTDDAERNRHLLSDFSQIQGFVPWVYEESDLAVSYLQKRVLSGDFVVTHHLPSWKSVHPQYAGSPLNAFFVCDVEDVLAEKKTAFWIHGHTHHSVDYRVGDTRVLCNPLGYAKTDVNPKFNDALVVEV